MLSPMTHERETRRVVRLDLCARRVRRLIAGAGLAVVIGGSTAPAGAQVVRSFIGSAGPAWAEPSNWSPVGVPTPTNSVLFGQSGQEERLVLFPFASTIEVRSIQVAPGRGLTTRYRLDLEFGTLTATALNSGGIVVGAGGADTFASLVVENGELAGPFVNVAPFGPASLTAREFSRLTADELRIGGVHAGLVRIEGGSEVFSVLGRLSGDVVLAHGRIEVAGGFLDVAGGLLVGVERTGPARASVLDVQGQSFVWARDLLVGPGSLVTTPLLELSPEFRGLAPGVRVSGPCDLRGGSAVATDYFAQRTQATLRLSQFAGESPLMPLGAADIAGTLIMTFAPTFDPPLGSEFALLSADENVFGRWSVAYLPGLGDARFLTIDYPEKGGPAVVVLQVDNLDRILEFDEPKKGFSIPSGPTAAVMGDFNNDDKPDVAIAFADPDEPLTAPGSVVILLNRGVDETGWLGFESQITLTVLADPRAIDAADFDLDGNLDVIVAGYTPQAAQVIQNLGTSYDVLAPIALTSGPVDIKTADFSGDGRPDAVCAMPDIESTVLLINELRAFGLVPQLPELVGLVVDAVDPFDPDADKDSDIGGGGSVGGRGVSGAVFVLPNEGKGGFGEPATTDVGDGPVDIASGDFDGDGFPELVTVDFGSDTVSVLVNDGQGGFAQAFGLPVGGLPRSITVNDFDGDEDLDIAIVADASFGRAIQLIRNDTQSVGDLVFAPVSDVGAGPDPSIVLSADLNADGRVDLLAINPLGPRGIEGGQVTAVLSKSGPRCPADFTGDGVVNQTDVDAFISAWFRDLEIGSFIADFNRDSVVNSTDVSDFINAYLNTSGDCLE